MAKIAVDLERAVAHRDATGGPGVPTSRLLAQGDGWFVADLLCTSGPRDRPFEEQHTNAAIAIVAAGTFQYRSTEGREFMTPGSLLLGNPGQGFECGHDHGAGDRCVSFHFTPDYLESIAASAGFRGRTSYFATLRVPPVRELSPLIGQACAGVLGVTDIAWEELSLRLTALAIQLSHGLATTPPDPPPSAIARVTPIVRAIQNRHDEPLPLAALARDARLSPYHFLRTFERLTGLTPHQYIRRTRLREAATRLAEPGNILDIALDSGFGDVSNFNRAFRGEFGLTPRAYRRILTRVS